MPSYNIVHYYCNNNVLGKGKEKGKGKGYFHINLNHHVLFQLSTSSSSEDVNYLVVPAVQYNCCVPYLWL